jgi:hypothetical protein
VLTFLLIAALVAPAAIHSTLRQQQLNSDHAQKSRHCERHGHHEGRLDLSAVDGVIEVGQYASKEEAEEVADTLQEFGN